MKLLIFRALFSYVFLSFGWFLYEIFSYGTDCILLSEMKGLLSVSLLKGLGFIIIPLILSYLSYKKEKRTLF